MESFIKLGRRDMSYLGLSEMNWMFVNNRGNVVGIPMHIAYTYGQAYELAFEECYG